MRRLFNFFNKKASIDVPVVSPKPITMSVNNSKYTICDFMDIKIQSIADDVKPYGWSLEFRHKYSDGRFSQWSTYWNNHIYQSRNSAIDAGINVGKMFNGCEYRLTALYAMREPEYRNYKIEQLVGDKADKKKYEIKSWKVNSKGPDFKLKEGTVFIQLESGIVIKSATPTIGYSGPGSNYRSQLFCELIPKEVVDEVDIKDEKWLYPHLIKELKAKINKTT